MVRRLARADQIGTEQSTSRIGIVQRAEVDRRPRSRRGARRRPSSRPPRARRLTVRRTPSASGRSRGSSTRRMTVTSAGPPALQACPSSGRPTIAAGPTVVGAARPRRATCPSSRKRDMVVGRSTTGSFDRIAMEVGADGVRHRALRRAPGRPPPTRSCRSRGRCRRRRPGHGASQIPSGSTRPSRGERRPWPSSAAVNVWVTRSPPRISRQHAGQVRPRGDVEHHREAGLRGDLESRLRAATITLVAGRRWAEPRLHPDDHIAVALR